MSYSDDTNTSLFKQGKASVSDSTVRSLRKTLKVCAIVSAALVAVGTNAAQANTSPNLTNLQSVVPRPAAVKCMWEVLNGNSLRVELIVTCDAKSAIFTYSKIDGVYCDAAMKCAKALKPLAASHFRARSRHNFRNQSNLLQKPR